MTLTYGQLSTEVQHALGGRPSTVGTQTVAERTAEIVNQAGTMLFAHPWRFRETVETFATVADQQYVALPDTVAAVRAAWLSNIRVTMTTPQQIESARSSSTWVASGPIGAVRMALSGGEYIVRMELFPTPTTSTADALKVMHMTAWTLVDSETSDDETMPVPVYAEQLLREYVRAVALAYEDGGLAERTQAIMAGPAWATCRQMDSQIQTTFGPLDQVPYGHAVGLNIIGVADPS